MTRSTRRSGVLLGWLLLQATGWTTAASALAVGTELQVNTYTVADQKFPAIAMDADGDFVVVWESDDDQDGSASGVFAQRFASSGARLGAELQVSTFTIDNQDRPAVAMDGEGDFVVVWRSAGQDGYNYGVFARRFSSAGTALAIEFQVPAYTVRSQEYPAVAMNEAGAFVVVWESNSDQDGESSGVFVQRFASSGARVGGEMQANVFTPGPQSLPKVAISAAGDFVVAWQSSNDFDGFGNGIAARRFSSDGTAVGGDFQVNAYTSSLEDAPAIGMDAAGNFVIAWEEQSDLDGSGRSVFAQRFASTGVRLGGEFQVNVTFTSSQTEPALGMNAAGSFVVVWSSDLQDGNSYGVIAQRFASSGVRLGGELQVNTHTPADQDHAVVALDASGDFAVAWRSVEQDSPSNDGIFLQRFASAPPLDVDGDGATEALTDGLLVLRRLFGFTGATLITGAVDTNNCTRCTAGDIEAHLAAIASQLDIDGDGEVQALTDGLLVLRWTFGFTGATLITGAVDTDNCTRCTAGDISTYIQSLAV